VQRTCRLPIAATAGVLQGDAQAWRHVCRTEIQPLPPASLKASAVRSSPDSRIKSDLVTVRISEGRRRLPVASLMPTIAGYLARRAIVAGIRSTPVRDGTFIEDEGKIHRVGYGREMPIQALLGFGRL